MAQKGILETNSIDEMLITNYKIIHSCNLWHHASLKTRWASS